ncbi:hypothetical protein K437DRAFT_256306 [Tilletiaria anomala UBC 951]|uniref:Mediator of RNA polymerase II transcription subunit 1 n=1 Tax=Tilletiaria anomala (strain ATCC 24038 / CBS 436.72 / UBC 951) TaxID=1037660 RepID=A0A066VWL0_TILAU|nr:uncharacterized protein K437DRAFT_256306 [Tilletiaria anomala UBC 951]KDN46127.1 hypothetical protein K437DRAFT_256306 [Tilletiaria anomala UBC 951]
MPGLSRQAFAQALQAVRTSLDWHRSKILPVLVRPGGPSTGDRQPAVSPSSGPANVPTDNSITTTTMSTSSKERFLMLLREQSADDATLQEVVGALLQGTSLLDSETKGAPPLRNLRRRLPQALVWTPKRLTRRPQGESDANREAKRCRLQFGSHHGSVSPSLDNKGKAKAVDGEQSHKASSYLPPPSPLASTFLSRFQALSSELHENTAPHPVMTFAEARTILLRLSSALSSLGTELKLEHLEDRHDVEPEAQEATQVQTHTLTIAGKILVLDFEFLLSVAQKVWSPSIRIRISYATSSGETNGNAHEGLSNEVMDVQHNNSEKARYFEQSLDVLLQNDVQKISEVLFNLETTSHPSRAAELQDKLEAHYARFSANLETLVRLDRSKVQEGCSDPFSSMARVCKQLQQAFREPNDRSICTALNLASPYLTLVLQEKNVSAAFQDWPLLVEHLEWISLCKREDKLSPCLARLHMTMQGTFGFQFSHPLAISQSALCAVEGCLSVTTTSPALHPGQVRPIFELNTIGLSTSLLALLGRPAPLLKASKVPELSTLKIVTTFDLHARTPGNRGFLLNWLPIPAENPSQVLPALRVIQQQLKINRLIEEARQLAWSAQEQNADHIEEQSDSTLDLDAELDSMLSGTAHNKSVLVVVSLLDPPRLGLSVSFTLVRETDGRTRPLHVTAELEPDAEAISWKALARLTDQLTGGMKDGPVLASMSEVELGRTLNHLLDAGFDAFVRSLYNWANDLQK